MKGNFMNQLFPECIGCCTTACSSFLFSKPQYCPDYQPSSDLLLYHGSRKGIEGVIRPISREECDFGPAFYMGVSKLQPASLVAAFPTAIFYDLSFDLRGLKVLYLKPDIDWAMLVGLNRKKFKQDKCPSLYRKYSRMSKDYDVIVGCIADDRIYSALDAFFRNRLSVENLIKCLTLMKLGLQIACVTQNACNNVRIKAQIAISKTNYISILNLQNEIQNDGCTI